MTLPLCQHCGEKPVMRQGAKYCTYVCRQTAKYIRKIAALGLQEAECADCGRTFKFKVSAKYCGPCVTRRKKMQNRTPDAGLVTEKLKGPEFPQYPPIKWPSDVTPWRAGSLADTPEIPDRQAMTRAEGVTELARARAVVHTGQWKP